MRHRTVHAPVSTRLVAVLLALLFTLALEVPVAAAATPRQSGPAAGPIIGRVVHIEDGDTVTLDVAGRRVRLTLARILASPKRSAIGARQRRRLAHLVFGRELTVRRVEWLDARHVRGEAYLAGHTVVDLLAQGRR